MERRNIDISWESLLRVLLFVVLVGIMYEGRQIILGLFLAIIISSGLEGIVDKMAHVGLPRSISVILLFLFAVVGVIFILYSVVPVLILELNTIFSGADKNISGSLGSLLNISSGSSGGILSSISSQFLNGATPLAFFSSALGSFGLAIAVIISSFYLSLSEDGVERFIKVVIPPDYEPQALKIYSHSRRLIGSWFRTQLLLSLIMGLIVWIGLLLLHVPYAFLIGFIAAACELVPFVGPIISGAIGVVTALTISSTLALYTLIFFLIAQQFESNLLVPLLNRRSVGLHPVIVIVALLIGAEIGGFLGIVIAVPAAAVFQEVIQDWSTKKRAIPMVNEIEA
jgi:predicted PurR-regulated permease PerM